MLTREQKRKFEKQLTNELQEVSHRLAHHRGDSLATPAEGEIASQKEPATSSSMLLSDQLANSEENLIAKITLALTRLEEGTYDQCEDCGAAIPIERLEAKPSASRCVACQSKRDPR